jgi:hypothetical protein
MELPAHSISGLRAKALVALYGNISLWGLSEVEDSYAALTIRSLIESFGGSVWECLKLAELSEAKAEAGAEERETSDATVH